MLNNPPTRTRNIPTRMMMRARVERCVEGGCSTILDFGVRIANCELKLPFYPYPSSEALAEPEHEGVGGGHEDGVQGGAWDGDTEDIIDEGGLVTEGR